MGYSEYIYIYIYTYIYIYHYLCKITSCDDFRRNISSLIRAQSFNTLEATFGNNPYLYNYLVLDRAPSWHSIILYSHIMIICALTLNVEDDS